MKSANENRQGAAERKAYGDTMTGLLEQLNTEMAEVATRTQGSLVHVRTGWRGGGAGLIIHPEGLVLTNAHVARRRRPEITLPDGRRLPARVVAHDSRLDLAALTVETGDLPAIEIGDSRSLEPGELVLALGHPWGVAGAVTAGAVIGVGADLAGMPRISGNTEWVAVGLHLRPGHSGGPLVNGEGQLVGINTMMAGPDVGLAVPSHVAKRFLRHNLGDEGRVASL